MRKAIVALPIAAIFLLATACDVLEAIAALTSVAAKWLRSRCEDGLYDLSRWGRLGNLWRKL